jgi:hypothetical protein
MKAICHNTKDFVNKSASTIRLWRSLLWVSNLMIASRGVVVSPHITFMDSSPTVLVPSYLSRQVDSVGRCLGVKLDDRFTWSGGVPTYRIHGQLSHRIGSLLPEQIGGQCWPMFAQLYIYDTSNELRNRQAAFAYETMQDAILENLQDMLHQYNPYAVAFRNVSALLRETPGVTQLMMRIVT